MNSIVRTFAPKVTVVTVVFNSETSIEQTLLSVINQTYNNLEYIVIDGASTDDTINVINKYEDEITSIICEPDLGPYDAMNKGVECATGEWITFLNSGDSFFKCDTIENIFSSINHVLLDVIYGDTNQIYKVGSVIKKALPLERISEHLPFCHQSCFTRRSLLIQYPYSLKYKIASDYEFYYKMYTDNKVFYYSAVTISNYYIESGISSNRLSNYKEFSVINGTKYSICYYVKFLLLSIRVFIISLIPRKILYNYRVHSSDIHK